MSGTKRTNKMLGEIITERGPVAVSLISENDIPKDVRLTAGALELVFDETQARQFLSHLNGALNAILLARGAEPTFFSPSARLVSRDPSTLS